MNAPTPRRPLLSGVPSSIASRTVCVVDPQPEDYRGWEELAQAHAVQVRFFSTASESLRHARDTQVSLWVINATLAGLSGIELCGMLRAQSPEVPIYLVSDQYAPAVEIAALRSRATLFGCKGSHGDWLRQWAERFAPRATSVRTNFELQPVH